MSTFCALRWCFKSRGPQNFTPRTEANGDDDVCWRLLVEYGGPAVTCESLLQRFRMIDLKYNSRVGMGKSWINKTSADVSLD